MACDIFGTYQWDKITFSRNFRLSRERMLGFLPENMRIAMLPNCVAASRPIEPEHIDWCNENCESPFYVDDSGEYIWFSCSDDPVMFITKFS